MYSKWRLLPAALAKILVLLAALFSWSGGGAVAPAQADTLTVFGQTATLSGPGTVSLPVAAAADANFAAGLIECEATCFWSDWVYFNSTGTMISLADGLYPNGPPPGTIAVTPCLVCVEQDGTVVDIGRYAFGAGQGFITVESSGDPPLATPIPAALPLFAAGLGALGLLGWHRTRKAPGIA